MNNLSWFLYLADVIGNLQVLFGFAGAAATIVSILLLAGTAIEYDKLSKNGCWFAGLAFFLIILACVIPSRTTMYLIAGSEIGGMAVTSDTGQEMINDIRQVIDAQLEQLKGDTDGND